MRRVNRSAVDEPDVLGTQDGKGAREYKDARAYQQRKKDAKATGTKLIEKSFEYSAYSDDGVKFALTKLFHGKCAYCESYYFGQAPVDVEHYRPKGQVAQQPDHPGYWWKAMAWDNLLPSCIDCNRRRGQQLPDLPTSLSELLQTPNAKGGIAPMGKQDIFPISGTYVVDPAGDLTLEGALLLNPAEDEPGEHLEFYLDGAMPLGLVLPRLMPNGKPSPKGLTSIHVYGLNRLGLVQERTRILRKLDFIGLLLDDLLDMRKDLLADGTPGAIKVAGKIDLLREKVVEEIRRMSADDEPHCTLVRAWRDRLRS